MGNLRQLVCIEWIDSNTTPEVWQLASGLPPLEIFRVVTVGLLVDEDEALIRVACSFAATESGGNEQFQGLIVIPKVAVQRRRDMSLACDVLVISGQSGGQGR
jgi:hypothetical protein